MKKIIFFMISLLITLGVGFESTFAAVCDQSFNGGMLRYEKAYQFYDTWNNNGNATDYINSLDVDYTQNGTWNKQSSSTWSYLDAGSPFDLSKQLRDANFAVAGKSSMMIVDTLPTNWRIQKKPTTRTNGTINSYDFGLRYIINYDNSNNFPNTNDDKIHTECVYYSVSSCGDGVLDNAFEVCDPTDPNRVGWGNGGCNTSCEPITVNPVATCDNITATPTGGIAPFTTNIVCEGTNASSYKIQCGNGQTINSRTGTCTYMSGSNYQAQCIVNNNITSNACKQTIYVTSATSPLIEIDKRDINSNDIDGVQGNDTQTVVQSNEAVFKIRVKNIGSENLKNLNVVDSIAPNCAGFVTLPNTKPNTWSNFVVAGSGNHSNNVLEPGEYYEYTCEKANTQSAYDNVAGTRGTGVNSNILVSDVDDTEVLIITPKIQVVKIDANSNDRDSIPGNDTQSVRTGETAVFGITVINNGFENLKNIKLTDALAPACDSNGSNVNLSGKSFTNKLGTIVNITFSGLGNHNDNILQIGEKFTYTCEKGNTQSEYTNIVSVSGVGVDSNAGVSDDDDTVVIIDNQADIYDLALDKKRLGSELLYKGDTVTFTITVFNQGTLDSGVVEIIDYIPNGLTLTGATWTQSGSTAVRTIANIPAGGNTPVNISFTIDDDTPKNINNFAEISDDNGDDCDSTPDSINGNGDGESTGLIDNDIGTNCEDGGDEDDHDIAPIVVENGDIVPPSCDSLTASPNSNQGTSLTTTLTCIGTQANIYRIEVRDEAGNLVETVNAATGVVTLTRGAAANASFTAKCFVNNTVTSNSCEQSLSITSGGGGSVPVCLDIIKKTANTYECVGNKEANSISMRCGTDVDTGNTVYLPTQAGILGTDARRTATFTCNDPVPKCIVRKVPGAPTPTNENNWVDSVACEYKTGFCGDGIVGFRADGTQEVCDAGVNNGKPGFTCTAQCTIPGGGSSSGGSSSSSSGGGEIICNPDTKICSVTTTPTGGEMVFGPFGNTVVGHLKNILANIPEFPYIKNESEYDYSFEELCIKKTSGDDSVQSATVGNNEVCVDISNKMLYGYETFVIAQKKSDNGYVALSRHTIDKDQILANPLYKYPDFMSNKNAIPVNKDFGEVTLTTTIKHDIDKNGTIDDLYEAYFAADLDIRVAKPSIATIGGGVSYVKNGSQTTGDIRKVTDGMTDFTNNSNFVGASVSDTGISSYVEDNTNSTVVNDSQAQSDVFKEDVTDVVTNIVTVGSLPSLSGFDTFSNFNGLDNVYILKGKNITLAELPASVNTPTTYIVEGGNLTLTKDIITNENIAFVVKGGNITIKSDVEKLSGTYIAIPVNGNGGKIISESSSKQLIVYGSLLGNLDELISNRYYIERSGTQLSVGTIVSFGSRLLSKPAPLVAQFKSEYNASQKVAR